MAGLTAWPASAASRVCTRIHWEILLNSISLYLSCLQLVCRHSSSLFADCWKWRNCRRFSESVSVIFGQSKDSRRSRSRIIAGCIGHTWVVSSEANTT